MGRSRSKYSDESRHLRDEYGNFIDWRKSYQDKDEWLHKHYKEVECEDFIKEVMLQAYLDEHPTKDELLQRAAFFEGTGQEEGLHTGKGTGLLKWTYGQKKDGEPLISSMEVYNDFKHIIRVKNNKLALINLCSYYGRNKYQKKADDIYEAEVLEAEQNNASRKPSKYMQVSHRLPRDCFGIAIDLDYVRLEELTRLVGQWENKMIPYPTYLVMTGAGVHLYYLFYAPVKLKTIQIEGYLQDMKRMLIDLIWNDDVSLDEHRQYSGIYQDMRVPGSWTKFGYENKKTCKYINKAFKIGERVDLTYLEEFVDKEYLPKINEYGCETVEEHLTLEQCATLFPMWYESVVLKGENTRRKYIQNEGLYKWFLNIISKEKSPTGYGKDIAHIGNRYYCMRVLFALAYKSNVSFAKAYEDAQKLLTLYNKNVKVKEDEFKQSDIDAAAEFYSDEYSRWSNKTIQRQTGIDITLYIKTKRTDEFHYKGKIKMPGRPQALHLKLARAKQDILYEGKNWREGNGRPKGTDKSSIVKSWREKNPNGTKYQCIKETGLTKPTVYKWWND